MRPMFQYLSGELPAALAEAATAATPLATPTVTSVRPRSSSGGAGTSIPASSSARSRSVDRSSSECRSLTGPSG